MSNQGFYTEQPSFQPISGGFQQTNSGPVASNGYPASNQVAPAFNGNAYPLAPMVAPGSQPLPGVYHFNRIALMGADGKESKVFDSSMPPEFAQHISGVEFADRFTQINGLYLAETQQINKEKQTGYRISGIIIVVSLILQVVGAIDFKKNNTSIPWLLISALAVGLVGCVILVRAMSSRDSKIKKLHAQIAALLTKFNVSDQSRRLRWTMLIREERHFRNSRTAYIKKIPYLQIEIVN